MYIEPYCNVQYSTLPCSGQLLPQRLGDLGPEGPLERVAPAGQLEAGLVGVQVRAAAVRMSGRVTPHDAVRVADQPDQRPLARFLTAADACPHRLMPVRWHRRPPRP